MRHPRAPRTVRMDQLWLVIETLSITGHFNLEVERGKAELKAESKMEPNFDHRF